MLKLALFSYFVVVLFSLFFKKKGQTGDAADFLLAGRKLSLLPFVATLVTTSYGWINGIGEIYAQYGISAWLFLSLPYTSFGLLVAFFFTKKLRFAGVNSIPELLEQSYAKPVAKLGALLLILLVSPAMYVLMGAQVIKHTLGWPLVWGIPFIILFSSIYLYRGGLQGLIRNDLIKFSLMFIGFAAALFYLFQKHGTEVLNALPSGHLEFSLSSHWPEVLAWFALASIVLADPSYHQRIYASKDPATAKRGIILAVGFWTLFDFLAAGLAMYALVLVPNADSSILYLELGQAALPEGLYILFFLGILSTILSTADSFIFLEAQCIAMDLLPFKGSTEARMRLGLLLSSLLTFVLLLFYIEKSAVNIFLDFTPFIVAGLVSPVLYSFSRFKLPALWTFIQMILSLAICAAFTLFPQTWFKEPINPVLPALFFSLVFPLFFSLISRLTQTKKG